MHKIFFLYLIFVSSLVQSQQRPVNMNEWLQLSRYEKDNQRIRQQAPNKKRVVFMGNSITEQWSVYDSAFFIRNLYINRGISGQTTSQMLLRFREDVLELKPAVVVLLAGINDIAENAGPYSSVNTFGNIQSMAELAKANGIKVVLCSVLPALSFKWRPEIKPVDKILHLNTLIRNYCNTNAIPYVDYYSALADSQKGLPKDYSYDGVHPNLNGYKRMAPLVEAAIQKLFLRK
jgi:lysophospholipase L1-like esterase